MNHICPVGQLSSRTALSRISGGYFFAVFMTPSSQLLESPINPGRFNGLIRQYFHKGYDFSSITHRKIQTVMDKLNNRPRKCLGMNTPNQVFFNTNPSVAFQS